MVRDGIGELLDYARPRGMPLAIEPLHPMYAADRACVNTMAQAHDLCDALDPARSGALGVAVDVYHVWWDPQLERADRARRRAQPARLLAFHVCDWLVPTTDLLNDRGMMGDGVIDLPRIRGWMERQGYAGYTRSRSSRPGTGGSATADEVLATCIERHRECSQCPEFEMRLQNPATLARIWSAVLVQTNGFGSSL